MKNFELDSQTIAYNKKIKRGVNYVPSELSLALGIYALKRVDNGSKNNYMKLCQCKSSYPMNSIVGKGLEVTFCFEKKMIHKKGVIHNDNEQNESQLLGTSVCAFRGSKSILKKKFQKESTSKNFCICVSQKKKK